MGHLASTIIGKAVCCILECCGNGMNKINHVGNWVMKFGMLIYFSREECPDIGADDGCMEK
eukprot:15338187-Ditylum_brightwellii.AAC.1